MLSALSNSNTFYRSCNYLQCSAFDSLKHFKDLRSVKRSLCILRHLKISNIIENTCYAEFVPCVLRGTPAISPYFLRNRIQYSTLYQSHNSQAMLNFRRTEYSRLVYTDHTRQLCKYDKHAGQLYKYDKRNKSNTCFPGICRQFCYFSGIFTQSSCPVIGH